MARPTFVDHIVYRVADIPRTERFYTALLGEPADRAEDSITYAVGDTRLFFTPVLRDRPATYDKEDVGLNHLAFGVQTLAELQTIASQLDTSGISHSGIKIDRYGKKEYIWLDDPDSMRIEFYLRPA
jgi:glyoxylase I family protein